MNTKLYRSLTFLFLLIVVVSCGDDDSTPPQATSGFTADKTTVKIGDEITFTNTSANATAFKWSFGDGTTSKDISPTKSYAAGGTYTVSLLSTGAGGSTISSSEITVLPDPELYYVDVDASLIAKFGITTPGDVTDFLDVSGMAGPGLAYDPEHQKVYFGDFEVTGEGKIWSVNLDGTDLKVIVDGLYDPYQISLDVENGKIYWAQDWDGDELGHIGRANLDGTDQEYVVTGDGWFYALAVDTKHDKIYYIDEDTEELYRANLDGSDATSILSDVSGYGIQVDTGNDKIYFENAETLYRANLDGSNVEPINDGGGRIYGIVVDNAEGRLYWSNRDTGEIFQANLDGTHKSVLKTGLGSPRGIFLKK
ncbi:DUF5050 domain-containing protein [Parachryseolinea silvisoli]|uniref:DUF5050 domain-containing protein n=1 Tax=Parachryseolinea silvisoli TaxID=2873601 RepID=UPI002265CB97|nr:DUF5050 domain-containing protein [Parachryseolinea silvisoli]MCD9017894.1 DUF5050 domain-containing protein [Parachryseolinea silvisoli]